MPTAGLRFLAVLLLSLAACPKRVMVNGQEMEVSQADQIARQELARARDEAAGLPPERAAERLLAVAERYRGVPAAGEALHDAADLLRREGHAGRAAAVYGTLLTEYPLHPRATEAKYGLALADIAQGRYRDGLRTIDSLFGRLPPSARAEAAAQAAAAAEAAGAFPEAVRWYDEVAARSDGPARAQALERAAAAVDRLALPEVERLRESLRREAPVQEALAMKLARLHLQQRDHARAQELAREVFLRWPNGAFAEDARALVDRLARLTFVRPNVVGVAVPLSGPFRRWGEAIQQGIALAFPEGSPVRVVARDTRGEPDGAAKAIEQLVLEEGAIAVIGGPTNAEAERAAATAEELQVPFVSLSRLEGVTRAGPHVFQNMLTATAQARALVELAMGGRGMRRFAILYPEVPYGVELANAFWDEVVARGGEIRAANSYAPDRTTFTPLVKDMVGKLYLDERTDFGEQVKEIVAKEKDPFRRRKAIDRARDRLAPIVDFEAIFIPDFAKNVRLIAPALAVEDVVTQTCLPEEVERIRKTTGRPDLRPVQLLGGNGWGGDPALFDTGPAGAGRHVRCAIYVDGFHAPSQRPQTRRFVEAFQARHGQTPTILEASAHDAAAMVRELLVAKGVQTRAGVRDGLASLRGFPGATGDLSFGPERTPSKELFFLTLAPDGLRELTPGELSPGAGGGQP